MSSASNTLVTTPIQRLNRDLLWYIVKMNANMFLDDNALQTTCVTAQVCRDWRRYMLAMPSLWAKLIDLDCLHYVRSAWRNELMRRSGNSLLWIKGHRYPITKKSKGLVSFFFLDVLGENWNRIQKLDVQLDVEHVDPTWWFPLCLPAPHLQSFDLTFWDTMDDMALKECPFGTLFAGEAPMLREFNSRGYRFSLQAPWLHQLRSMEIHTTLDISELLTVLIATPNLEWLRVDRAAMEDRATPLPRAHLPTLDSVTLFTSLESGATLLDHLDVAPGCSLNYFPYHIRRADEVSEENFSPVARTLSNFARRYFQFHQPAKISLDYSQTCISFENKTCPGKFKFVFRLGFVLGVEIPLHVVTILLGELSLPEFSKTTEFQLHILGDFPIPPFTSFLACLPSIEVIDTRERTISYLIKVQNDMKTQANNPNIVFPFAKTVKLDALDATYFLGIEGAIYKFILSRLGDGCPIEVLDLTQCNSDFTPSLCFLEEFSGLKILWTKWGVEGVLEYVCGSGNPERLQSYVPVPDLSRSIVLTNFMCI